MRARATAIAMLGGVPNSHCFVESIVPICSQNLMGHHHPVHRMQKASCARFQSNSQFSPTSRRPFQRSRSVKLPADAGGGNGGNTSSGPDRQIGILVLLTVPMAWGTFEPAVRYVYAIQPPVPGFVFSVAYYLVAAASLSFLVLMSTASNLSSTDDESSIDGTDDEIAVESGESTSLPIRGGMELGLYLFLGNGLQVLGLKTVPSDRAAFLLQLTTIFVPLVQAIFLRDIFVIPPRTWGACLIALLGVAIMALDGQVNNSDDGSDLSTFLSSFHSLSSGDLLIILAAFSYTFHCIRLGRFARETSALKLAACKATTETALSLALVLTLVAVSQAGGTGGTMFELAMQEGSAIAEFVTSFARDVSSGAISAATLLPAAGAVLWTGLVTIAYTIYAQSFGQSRVDATDANLIYTIQPLFTALVAWALLGETLGPAGYIGGSLIGSAVYLVATAESDCLGSGEDWTRNEVVASGDGDTPASSLLDDKD